jgi:isopentenyldiphosphate isomerase
MEKRDLYDEFRNITGEYVYADQDTPEGRYILLVAVFIQNSKGEFLIQKRSVSKGGKWATTGGHPKMGEDSIAGICTEVLEEIGVDLKPYKDQLILFKTHKGNSKFADLYYINLDIDINKTKLQEEEVQDLKWFTISDIENLIEHDEFHESHTKMFRDCMKYLNKIKTKK